MISTERISQRHYLLLRDCGVTNGFGNNGSLSSESESGYLILYVSEGACRLIDKEDSKRIEAGNIILLSPSEESEYHIEEDAEVYYLRFSGEDCESLLCDLSLCGTNVFFMGKSKEFEETFAAMRMEHYFKRRDSYYATSALLLKLLVVISRKYLFVKGEGMPEQAGMIYQAIESMHLKMEEGFSLRELAQKSGYSVGRFSHLFRLLVGVAPHEYLTSLRIEKAKDLLVHTHYSIAGIARAVGIEDQNYFSRFFKKQTGISPTEYRKNR